MKKSYPIVVIFLFLLLFMNCSSIPDGWKELDVKLFKITVPQNWKFEDPGQQEDSFVGHIMGAKMVLSFDCSDMGYANHLISTEDEYIKREEWKQCCYFYKPGVLYTAKWDVKKEKLEQMKKLETTDSTLVHVEADPSYETKTTVHRPTASQKTKFPKADYIADMTYRDSTIYVPIMLPYSIKSENIQLDSNSKYVFKTIWPKLTGKGMTGIYIHSRTSNMNFQMNGSNLSAQDQADALKAFKTITFK